MTDKARELLERALEWIEAQPEPRMIGANDISKEIRAYLAEPEVKRKRLSEIDIQAGLRKYANRLRREPIAIEAFIEGAIFAEKHHEIGDGDENPDA